MVVVHSDWGTSFSLLSYAFLYLSLSFDLPLPISNSILQRTDTQHPSLLLRIERGENPYATHSPITTNSKQQEHQHTRHRANKKMSDRGGPYASVRSRAGSESYQDPSGRSGRSGIDKSDKFDYGDSSSGGNSYDIRHLFNILIIAFSSVPTTIFLAWILSWSIVILVRYLPSLSCTFCKGSERKSNRF